MRPDQGKCDRRRDWGRLSHLAPTLRLPRPTLPAWKECGGPHLEGQPRGTLWPLQAVWECSGPSQSPPSLRGRDWLTFPISLQRSLKWGTHIWVASLRSRHHRSQVTGHRVAGLAVGTPDTYRGDGSPEKASDAPEVTQLASWSRGREPSMQGKAGWGLF